MNKNNNETSAIINPVYPRSISIDENIHATLTLYALSLYMALRFEADYRKEESEIKRSAQFLYNKAKISRAQYYRALNELEKVGLLLRSVENKLGDKCKFHVARELGWFARGVSDRDRGVSDRDTDQYSLPSNINNITSVSDETNTSKSISNQEILDAYHEHLPEMTRIKTVDRELANKIKAMQKNWHKYQKEGKKFTIELFVQFMQFVRKHHYWFIKPYTTESGNQRKNSLRNLITEKNLAKFANGEFSAN